MAPSPHIFLATVLVASTSALAAGDKPLAQLSGNGGTLLTNYRNAYDELQKVGPTNKLYFCVFQQASYTTTPEQAAKNMNPAEVGKRLNDGRAMPAGLIPSANPNHEMMQTPESVMGNLPAMASSTMYAAMRETLEYTHQIRYESREHTAEECATAQAAIENGALSVANANYDCTTDLPKLSAQEKSDSAKYGRLSLCFSHLLTRMEYVQKRFHNAFDGKKFMDSGTCAGTTAVRDTVSADLETQRQSLADLSQMDADKSKLLAGAALQLDAALKSCGTAGTSPAAAAPAAAPDAGGSTITGDTSTNK